MHEWNVVVTVRENGFRDAIDLLEDFGPISRTDYFNVLVMQVADWRHMMERLSKEAAEGPRIANTLAKVVPALYTFDFYSPEEFEAKAKEIALQLAPALSGKKFHVRMHRRGFKGRLKSTEEERFLDGVILEKLENAGSPGEITFEKPDAILGIETVGQRAGMSLWNREELERYPLLGLIK